MKQRAKHGTCLVTGVEIVLHHRLDHLFAVRIHLIRGKELKQAGADKANRGFLFGDNLDDIFTVKIPGLTQEGFLGIIVIIVAIFKVPSDAAVRPNRVLAGPRRHVLGVAQGPAGKGARTL